MPITIKDKPDKPPKPTTTTSTTSAPVTTTPAPQPVKANAPSGAIATAGFSGVNWEAVTQYDDAIHAAADRVGWPVERVRGHILIESQGNPRAMQNNAGNGDSYGLMQVVPYGVGWEGWHKLVKEKAGLPANASKQQVIDALYNPVVNIAAGVAILEGFYEQHGTLDKASSAFFLGNPNWKGEDTFNGNTGTWYRNTLNALIKEQDANGTTPAITTTPAPVPQKKVTAQDVLNLISSKTPGVYVSFPFLGLNTDGNGNPVNIYAYGKGHGTTANNMHPGIDIWMPDETPVNAVFAGEVICVGTQGEVVWGQGCGYFSDDNGGIGKISVLTDRSVLVAGKERRMMMVYGHMSASYVRPGERIVDGQCIGRSGIGATWPHVHLDVGVKAPELNNPAIWNNPGEYHLLDPLPTIIAVYAGEAPVVYAQRLPIPQPAEFDVSATVRATRDGVPVLQRAMLNATSVREPLKKGEEFEAVYQVIGNDKHIYWVSSLGSRIPVDGTESDEWAA